jgi:hypothetical protein
VPAQTPSATAAPPSSYTAKIVATGLATAAGALLTSVLDTRGTFVGAVVVAMIVSGLSQVMRLPLERRAKSARAILVIALMGTLVGIGAVHARDIAQGRVVSLHFVRSLLSDLIAEPTQPSADPAPAEGGQEAVPTPEQPASKPGTSGMPTDKASPPAGNAAKSPSA